MISFVAIYCPFGLICNATSLDLNKYIWLVYIMFIISGVVWNIIYFMVLSKLDKNGDTTKINEGLFLVNVGKKAERDGGRVWVMI